MKLTAQGVQAWIQVASQVLALGTPILHLVTLIKSSLDEDSTKAVLAGLKEGYQQAQAENDARIKELQSHL